MWRQRHPGRMSHDNRSRDLSDAAAGCWPKTNRLPVISPAKTSLFRIRKELQFWVYNHGKSCASPSTAREGQLFYRREKEVWRAIVNKESRKTKSFSLAELLPERRGGLSSSSWALLSSQGTRAPPSGLLTLFNWGFCLLIFYKAKEHQGLMPL